MPGARTTVLGEGVVLLSAESRHLARKFLDAMQKLGAADW
jgi:hypothetical protein